MKCVSALGPYKGHTTPPTTRTKTLRFNIQYNDNEARASQTKQIIFRPPRVSVRYEYVRTI